MASVSVKIHNNTRVNTAQQQLWLIEKWLEKYFRKNKSCQASQIFYFRAVETRNLDIPNIQSYICKLTKIKSDS